jgi:hypothetical protein
MPQARVPYENQTVFINLALNSQEHESTPGATTSIFALDNATRQPRRRAETMPWTGQTSILKSRHNSLQLKAFPKALPIPHFVQSEHDGEVEMGCQGQDGLGSVRRDRGHDYAP